MVAIDDREQELTSGEKYFSLLSKEQAAKLAGFIRIELMTVQIDKTRLDMTRVRQEMRWEPWKAVAGITAAIAAVSGIILTVAHIIH